MGSEITLIDTALPPGMLPALAEMFLADLAKSASAKGDETYWTAR